MGRIDQEMGIGDKISAGAIAGDIWDSMLKFRAPREVHVRNKRLATIYWALAAATLIYVCYAMFDGYEYLDTTTPVAVVGGYGEVGKMYTGVTSVPKYCMSPYTQDYVQPGSTDWQYTNVGCARYPMTDVMLKRAPSFQFFTTLMYERTYTMSSCATSTTCNDNTPGVNKVFNSCMCTEYASKYVLNPEGMNLVILHDVTAKFDGGNKIEGASRQANEKSIHTVLVNSDGEAVLEWNTPDEIKIEVSQLLELADLDLDTINTNEAASSSGSNLPYWRMTGATLVVDMEYRNYDAEHGDDGEIHCILTVAHLGSWESVGSESVDFQQPITYNSDSTGMHAYETQVVDRYRQGIKVVLKPHGSLGEVDYFAVINALLNGVVMMGMATTITVTVAKYFMCGGFSGIYRNYQDVEVKPKLVIARTAANAAAQASLFMRAFDRGGTGLLSQRMLFENIKLLCGEDLTELQIAQLVGDICDTADVDSDGKVAVDEFTHFMAPDECDLMNVIEKYKELDGDEDRLTLIQGETIDPAYEKQIKGMQAGVHELGVEAAAHGGERHAFSHTWDAPAHNQQTKVVPATFCTACGKNAIGSGGFCTACGTRQKASQVEVPAPAPAPPTATGHQMPPPPNHY